MGLKALTVTIHANTGAHALVWMDNVMPPVLG